jgi:hypothetical protein
MKLGRLNHIGVATPSIADSIVFYRAVTAQRNKVYKKETHMIVQKLLLNTAIIATLCLASASFAAPPKKAPNKNGKATASKSFGKEIPLSNVPDEPSKSTSEAYALVFNANAAATKTVKFEDKDFEMRGVNLSRIRNNVWALFSVANGEACGPCSGINAVHYLTDEEGGWKLKSEHLNIGATSLMGNPARRWAITPLLAVNPVLITRAGGLWQGYSCDVVNLAELTPSGPVDRGTLPVSYSNGGGAKEGDKIIDLDGTLVSGQTGKTLSIRFSGTSKFVENYTLVNGKYQLIGKPKLPAC